MRVHEFESYLRSLRGTLNSEEGVVYGDATAEVRGVLVCWMANLAAIRRAIACKANVILAHEALFYPYPGIRSGIPPTDCMSWPANRNRIDLLSRGRITVLRLHSTLDRLCITDDFAAALGLPAAPAGEAGGLRIYDVPETTVGDVLKKVKRNLKLDSVRVTVGSLRRKVRRIGLLPGGSALFVNVSGQAALMARKPDLFLAGESDCYGMHFAADANVAMIETSHAVSENPGLRRFTARISKELSPLPVRFFANQRPWRNL